MQKWKILETSSSLDALILNSRKELRNSGTDKLKQKSSFLLNLQSSVILIIPFGEEEFECR